MTFDYKVRVMPSCWFVLVRLFLRVDEKETRIRSYRYFHSYGSNKIDMSICWQTGSSEFVKTAQEAQAAQQITGTVFKGVAGAPDVPAPSLKNFFRDITKLSEILPIVRKEEIVVELEAAE